MKRKSLRLQEEAERIHKEFEEQQALASAQLKEEEDAKKATEDQINEICANRYFCGVILTKADIVNILALMLNTGEPVSIPFKLYFNDKDSKESENLNENGTV